MLQYPNNLLVDITSSTSSMMVSPSKYQDALEKAIDTLDEDRKLILEMRYKKYMTFKAIGEELGYCPSYARTRVLRALRPLRHPSRMKLIMEAINS